jgi:hypothetical protein
LSVEAVGTGGVEPLPKVEDQADILQVEASFPQGAKVLLIIFLPFMSMALEYAADSPD